jgi:molecular chaperone GrpE
MEHATHQAQDDAAETPERTVGELTDELARLEDRFKRSVADLDNYRKRVARDIERQVTDARERFIRDWLEVVDSIDRALQHDPDGRLAEPLGVVRRQMEAVLERSGVRRVGAPGEPFDPALHEAVAVRENDEAEDRTVVEVLRSGYVLDGRVLRPAQVVVARRPPAAG